MDRDFSGTDHQSQLSPGLRPNNMTNCSWNIAQCLSYLYVHLLHVGIVSKRLNITQRVPYSLGTVVLET